MESDRKDAHDPGGTDATAVERGGGGGGGGSSSAGGTRALAGADGSPLLAWGVAIGAGAAGYWLVAAGGTGIPAGLLLLTAALAAAGVAIGGGRWGPEVEGPLDLSSRLALGLLGGALAGLAHGVIQWLAGAAGLFGLPGIGVDPGVPAAGWRVRVVAGLALGLVYGVLLPRLPGASHVGRAAWFSLVPTLYLLLWHYPVELEAGLLGVRLGLLTSVAVAALNLAAASVAGAVMVWGERTDLAPLSRPLVE